MVLYKYDGKKCNMIVINSDHKQKKSLFETSMLQIVLRCEIQQQQQQNTCFGPDRTGPAGTIDIN